MTSEDRKTEGLALLLRARIANPQANYVINHDRTVIGGWNADLGRYQAVAFSADDGWREMPFEIICNGQPMRTEEWDMTI